MAYSLVVLLHSWLRWVLLALAVLTIARAVSGWRSGRDFSPADDRAGRLLVLSADLQLVLGLLLYLWLSPITRAALSDMAGTMKVSALRFFAVEHIFGMVLGVAGLHVTRVLGRRRQGARRHAFTAVGVGLSLLCILATVPWPGLPYARPLLRLAL